MRLAGLRQGPEPFIGDLSSHMSMESIVGGEFFRAFLIATRCACPTQRGFCERVLCGTWRHQPKQLVCLSIPFVIRSLWSCPFSVPCIGYEVTRVVKGCDSKFALPIPDEGLSGLPGLCHHIAKVPLCTIWMALSRDPAFLVVRVPE